MEGVSGVVGCEPVSWLKGVGCGLSSSALSVRGRAVARAGLGSGLCQACIARMLDQSPSMINREIKRNAGTDGCHRGGAYGRTLAHPSQGAHRGCRPCIPDPCLALPRGMRIPPDQRAPLGQGPERVAGVGRHMLASQQPMGAQSATRRLCTWIHTPSRRRRLVGAQDRVVLMAVRAQEGSRRRVMSPRSWACG